MIRVKGQRPKPFQVGKGVAEKIPGKREGNCALTKEGGMQVKLGR